MKSARLSAYLDLERAMITLDEAGDPLADRIRDRMIDSVWYALTLAEKEFLNRRTARSGAADPSVAYKNSPKGGAMDAMEIIIADRDWWKRRAQDLEARLTTPQPSAPKCERCGGYGLIPISQNMSSPCPDCTTPPAGGKTSEACPCGSTLPRERCHSKEPAPSPATGEELVRVTTNPEDDDFLVWSDIRHGALAWHEEKAIAGEWARRISDHIQSERSRARREAWEEAAKVCDSYQSEIEGYRRDGYGELDSFERGKWSGATVSAKRIRALAEGEQ